MRYNALFVYKNENEHLRVRNEIANYLYNNHHQFENISIPRCLEKYTSIY